jgi:hypothetical protein
MIYEKIDFNVHYRNQDISRVNKTIEKVNMILAFFNNNIIFNIFNINLKYSSRKETPTST